MTVGSLFPSHRSIDLSNFNEKKDDKSTKEDVSKKFKDLTEGIKKSLG